MTNRNDELLKAVENAGFDELKNEDFPGSKKTIADILADSGLIKLTGESPAEDLKSVLQVLIKESLRLSSADQILLRGAAKKHLEGFMGAREANALLKAIYESERSRSGNLSAQSKFKLKDNGLFYRAGDESDDSNLQFVCGHLEILGSTRDGKNQAWGRLVRFSDREGKSKTLIILMADLVGDAIEVRRKLADAGLLLSTYKNAADHLREYLSFYNEEAGLVRTTSKTGWHGKSFVLPDITIYPTSGNHERVLFEGGGSSLIAESGTLEDWKCEVAEPCRCNSRLMFAVGANFAALLLKLAGEENGGFNARGPSTIGKTTALVVGGSVNGGGDKNGFVRSWKATQNGVEGLAIEHNDLCLSLDELSQADPFHAGEGAYSLGNGTEKARGKPSGGLKEQRRFRLIFLSSGEISLEEHIKSIGKKPRAGQEVRVVDFPADAGKGYGIFENIHGYSSPDIFSRHLQDKAKTFFGTPLRSFLQYLVDHYDDIAAKVREYRSAFVTAHVPLGASGQIYRVCGRFGIVAAALLIAIEAKVLPWTREEAEWAIDTVWKQWLASRGTLGALDLEKAVKQVAKFVQAYGTSRFEDGVDDAEDDRDPIDDPGGDTAVPPGDRLRMISSRAGFRFIDKKGDYQYYIHPEVFRDEVCNGYSAQDVAAELGRRGYLKLPKTGYVCQKRVKGMGKPYFYIVSSKILELQ
jgi:uncharacterized protein (DUF927 family)